MDLQGIMLGEKKPISKAHTLYNTIYIKFLKWQYLDMEDISGCQGLGMVREEVVVTIKRQRRRENFVVVQ